jgi:hypothetical protein
MIFIQKFSWPKKFIAFLESFSSTPHFLPLLSHSLVLALHGGAIVIRYSSSFRKVCVNFCNSRLIGVAGNMEVDEKL